MLAVRHMIQELRSSHFEMLRRTLERARRLSPYYGASLAGSDIAVSSLSDLRALPLLSRGQLTDHLESVLIPAVEPFCINTTHGTTTDPRASTNSRLSHRPLMIFKDLEELDSKRAFQEALHSTAEQRPLICHLIDFEHGIDPATFGPGCFCMSMETPRHFDTVRALLSKRFHFEGFRDRVSVLAGSLRTIKAFTLLCQQRNISTREFGVEVVACYGNQLTTRWRSLLEDAWGVPVHDIYGLSEVPGLHAHWCTHCDAFHFSNLAIVETLDVLDGGPVIRGLARLVGTALYPLSSALPMIRYCTGDLVDIGDECGATGLNMIRYVGREGATLLKGRTVLLSPVTVHEVLDDVPDVATREFEFAEKLGLRFTGGFKKWRPVAADGELTIHIELRWPPDHYKARAAELAATLLTSLLDRHPPLAAERREGLDVSVRLLPPGALQEILVY